MTTVIPSPRTPALDELTVEAARAATRTAHDRRAHEAVGAGLAAIERLRGQA